MLSDGSTDGSTDKPKAPPSESAFWRAYAYGWIGLWLLLTSQFLSVAVEKPGLQKAAAISFIFSAISAIFIFDICCKKKRLNARDQNL